MLKKEKNAVADFDRLTYLIYHLVFKEYHIKSVDGILQRVQKGMGCLEALQEMGGLCLGNIGNTESEISLHKMWMQNFCKNAPKESKEWIQKLN